MRYRAKHAKPSWWGQWLCGTWTQNKLLSRKWWMAAGTVGIAIGLDIAGLELSATTLTFVATVVPAYLLVEGALDWRYKRKRRQADGEGSDVL